MPGKIDRQELFDRLIAIELSKTPVTCHKECSSCCHQLIPLSLAEVSYLHNLIRSFPVARQRCIAEKIRHITEVLKKQGMPFKLPDIYHDADFERAYFNLGIPCPFLEENACSIYLQRPFVCRDYYVTSPPALCTDPFRNGPQRIKTGINFVALMAVFSARVYGFSPLPIPLSHIIEWIHEHPSFLTREMSSQWLFECLLNGLTKADLKNSSIRSLHWKFVETHRAIANKNTEEREGSK